MEKTIYFCNPKLPKTSLRGLLTTGANFDKDDALSPDSDEELAWFMVRLDEDMAGTPHRKGDEILVRVHNMDLGHELWGYYTSGISVRSDEGHFDKDRDSFETDGLIID